MFFLERFLFSSAMQTQIIQYENIENVKVGREDQLIKELEERTGLEIMRFDVVEADYLKDSARIRIYFKQKD